MSEPTVHESFMELISGLSPICDAVQGYRAQYEAEGFSPTISEQMALCLHNEIVKTIFATQRTGLKS